MSRPPTSAGGGGGAGSALDIQLLIFECVALSQGSLCFGTRSLSLADGRDSHIRCSAAARCAPETSRDEEEPLLRRSPDSLPVSGDSDASPKRATPPMPCDLVDALDRADVRGESSESVLSLLVLARRYACVRDETWREGAQEALLEECATGGLPCPCSSEIGSNSAALRAKPLTPSKTTPSETPSEPKMSRSAPSPVCEGRANPAPRPVLWFPCWCGLRAMHSVPDIVEFLPGRRCSHAGHVELCPSGNVKRQNLANLWDVSLILIQVKLIVTYLVVVDIIFFVPLTNHPKRHHGGIFMCV